MSARATCWAHCIIQMGLLENTLSPKLVLLVIADRADQSGKCAHSSNSISKGLHISDTTVKAGIKYLQKMGVLNIIRRQSEVCDDVHLSNVYLLQIPTEFATDSALATPQPPAPAAEGVGQIPPHWGNSRRGSESDLVLKRTKIKSKSKHARASRACAPADAGAAATSKIEGKARRVRPSGLVTWTQADIQNCAKLEDAELPQALQAAVAEAWLRGKQPLPGVVAAILEERRVAAARAAAAAQAAARIEQIERASRARAARELPEMLALQANKTSQERDP